MGLCCRRVERGGCGLDGLRPEGMIGWEVEGTLAPPLKGSLNDWSQAA